MINTFDHDGNNFLAHENMVRIVTSYKSKIFLVNSYFRKNIQKPNQTWLRVVVRCMYAAITRGCTDPIPSSS